MDNIGIKKKYSSLKIDNITVIKLKTLAKQRGIEGYYKLRKAEMIQKLEAHPDVNEQVLIPWLEIFRNTTGSVNTSAILDDPILDGGAPDRASPLELREGGQRLPPTCRTLEARTDAHRHGRMRSDVVRIFR